MEWFSFILPFLTKFISGGNPTQTAGGAAFQGMNTPSYEAPAPVSGGQRFGQALGSGLTGLASSGVGQKQQNEQQPLRLQDLYKLFGYYNQ
jgi:hypothetical protein